MNDREYYASRPTDELKRLFRSAKDRSERAPTTEAYMIDAFQMQEVSAVLNERGEGVPA
jgi:hypothetical protein